MLQRKIKQVECFPIQLTIDRVDLVIQKANRFEGGQEDQKVSVLCTCGHLASERNYLAEEIEKTGEQEQT